MTILHSVFQDDPCKPFYNLDGLSTVALTTDIDWAPDFVTEVVFNLVSKYNFKLTVFATHHSDLLSSPPEFVEIGLHPDFTRPDPKHGISRKLVDLKELYPNAIGTRSHRNVFGHNISDLIKASHLLYDASTFLWREPFCQAHIDYNQIIRFAYTWEDGIHSDTNQHFEISQVRLHSPGLKILNVHPILIYLNCPNDQYRRDIVKNYSDLTKAPYSELTKHIYQGRGMRHFYEDILYYLAEHSVKSFHLADIANVIRHHFQEVR